MFNSKTDQINYLKRKLKKLKLKENIRNKPQKKKN